MISTTQPAPVQAPYPPVMTDDNGLLPTPVPTGTATIVPSAPSDGKTVNTSDGGFDLAGLLLIIGIIVALIAAAMYAGRKYNT